MQIVKDKNKNDILVVNNKLVPLNKRNTSLRYQKRIYDYCKEDIDYLAYEIKENLYSVVEKREDMYSVKIIKDDVIDMIDIEKNNTYSVFLDFNSKYVVVYSQEHVCPIKDVLSAYDIKNNKLIDCTDFQTKSQLLDAVVNYRRCMYDVISSIMNNQVLIPDEERLYSFMSFVTNKRIHSNNFSAVVPMLKEYIYHYYPELKEETMYTDYKNVMHMNEQYGIDHFIFKKMPYDIPGLSYIKNKKLTKR